VVDTSSIYVLICMLAAWMHLIGGVSRVTTTCILKFIEIIINTSIHASLELESQSVFPLVLFPMMFVQPCPAY